MSFALLLAGLVAFGVVTGVAAGILGVGGGVLMVPFLTLVAGMPQHSAEATSLLVVLPTAVVASLVLQRRGIGDLGLALRFGVVGALGAAGGALLALALPGRSLRVVFAVFLLLVGLRLVRDGLHTERS
ncbi:MAG: TSUP family transporter [Thermoleophilia bacterium]